MLRTLCILVLLGLVDSIRAQDTCFVQGVYINALLIDPGGSDFSYDTNNDAVIDSNDEFIELCNASSDSVDISGWTIGDDDLPPYPDYSIPDATVIAPGDCLLLVSNFCINTTGNCEIPFNTIDMALPFAGFLGNGGDAIHLSDNNGSSCTVTYGSMSCMDVDPLDLPGFSIEDCSFWGTDTDGCALLAIGDSCEYIPQALPVSFLSFTGRSMKDQKINLLWHTTDEINNRGFHIQWKNNYEEAYADIGWVTDLNEALDYDGGLNSYSFTHDSPSSGSNYYRLRQEDLNGDISYSEGIVVSLQLSHEIKVYPVPVRDQLTINGNSDLYVIWIYDLTGKLISGNVKKKNNESLDLGPLRSGYYVLRVFNGEYTSNFKILKI